MANKVGFADKKDIGINKDRTNDAENESPGFFVRYTQETSFSGLKYIGENGSWSRRLLWLIVVLVALSGLVFQISKCTDKFIRRPTSTKLSYVEKEQLDFPAITICNTFMFRVERLLPKYNSYYDIINGYNQIRKLFPQVEIIDAPDVPLPDDFPGKASLYDFIWDNAQGKEDTFWGCRFNREKCWSGNFTTIVTNYGVCFTFNAFDSMRAPLQIKTSGQLQGLSLLLNGNEDSNVPVPRLNSGFRILLHPRDEVPNLQDLGVELDMGKHTSIRIGPREIERLPKPFGNCLPGEAGNFKYLSGNYTKSKCFLECEMEFIFSQCGCRSYYMPGTAPYCKPRELVECFYPYQEHLRTHKHNLCACPDACKETKYEVSVSQTSFPSTRVALVLRSCNRNYTIEKAAFAKALNGRTSSLFSSAIGAPLYNTIYEFYVTASNKANQTIGAAFPIDIPTAVNNLLQQLASPMFYDIYFYILLDIYEDINPNTPAYNMTYGSSFYYTIQQRVADKYLHSGLYKSTFTDGLKTTYESLQNTNMTFEEFSDEVYHDFDVEAVFYKIEAYSYQTLHSGLLDIGSTIYEQEDKDDLTTAYMRKNFAQVDLYFGDMAVENVIEQKDYEVFQFICDCGGALGLFFGASLLSFIETIDFTFMDFFGRRQNPENKS